MSPEQAAGKPVDARTDVFSFGCCCTRCDGPAPLPARLAARDAVGHPRGRARAADESRARPAPEAERAILRCLHKEPSRRWQSMSDLTAVLHDLREDSESGLAKVKALPSTALRSRAWLWWATAALGVAAATVVAVLLYRRGPTPAATLEAFARLTYDTGLTTDPSISADGKLVAYASDRSGEGHMDIWVQLENQPQPARLTRHAADDWQPSISPDGSRIAFRSERDGGGILRRRGARRRGEEDRRPGAAPRFSPDGSQIAYLEDAAFAPRGLRMFLVRAEGGPPRPFQPDFGVRPPPGSMGPLWSPDGRFLLFAGVKMREQGRPDWWVAPVDGGPAVSTGASSLPRVGFVQIPGAWVGSHVLVAAGATMEGINLHRVRISPGDFKVTGPLEPLTSGTGVSYLASVAADGRMAIPRFNWLVQLWSIDAGPGRGSASPAPEALTHDAAPKFGFSLARDAPWMAYTAYAGSGGRHRIEVRLRDLARGAETTPHPDERPLDHPQSVPERGRGPPELGRRGGRSMGRDRRQGGRLERPRGLPGLQPRHATLRLAPRPGRHRTEAPRPAGPRGRRRDASSGAGDGRDPRYRRLMGRPVAGDDDRPARRHDRAAGRAGRRARRCADGGDPGRGVGARPREPALVARREPAYYMANRDGFVCLWAQALDPATKGPGASPSRSSTRIGTRGGRTCPGRLLLPVVRDRIVFNAAEITGNILMGKLPP